MSDSSSDEDYKSAKKAKTLIDDQRLKIEKLMENPV
jgi:hypothetical protein